MLGFLGNNFLKSTSPGSGILGNVQFLPLVGHHATREQSRLGNYIGVSGHPGRLRVSAAFQLLGLGHLRGWRECRGDGVSAAGMAGCRGECDSRWDGFGGRECCAPCCSPLSRILSRGSARRWSREGTGREAAGRGAHPCPRTTVGDGRSPECRSWGLVGLRNGSHNPAIEDGPRGLCEGVRHKYGRIGG